MLEQYFGAYSFNEPERFETMAMQTRVEFEPDKNIQVDIDEDRLTLGQEDTVPIDLLVPNPKRHKVKFKGEGEKETDLILAPVDHL